MDLRKTSAWLFLLPLLTGCTTVGTGYRTIVRAPCEIDSSYVDQKDTQRIQGELCGYVSNRYSHLVAPLGATNASLVLRIDPQGRPIEPKYVKSGTRWLPTYDQFLEFLSSKYGSSTFRPAELSFKAHERTVTPAYFATDPRASWAAAVTTLLGTGTLPTEERIRLQKLLEARLRHVPDLGPTTAPHHTEVCGPECLRNFGACNESCLTECAKSPDTPETCQARCGQTCAGPAPIYYYYPRLSVDFSSSFLSTSPADRLSYLAMVVRLHGDGDRKRKARFIDFRPKDAEIPTFSRGDFTEASKATLGAQDVNVFDVGVESSETYVSKLMDAIEKKSTGILEDGRTFFVDLRALREIRIAGSYNFDLMLEVPSQLKRGIALESDPLEKRVAADVFLLGVVRHVHARGRIGTFNRVPESENDHVYEQVVLRILPEQELWIAPQTPWSEPVEVKAAVSCKLQVLTNREDAAFTIRNESGATLDGGSGRRALVEVPTCGKVKVAFLPVVTDEQVLAVEGDDVREVDFGNGQAQAVEGKYLPKGKR